MRYLAAILALILSGCNARPYTHGERVAAAHAIIGQGSDVATTSAGFNRGLVELNPVWGDDPELSCIVLGKAVILCAGYALGEWKPHWRKRIYYGIGAAGYGAAGWNVYQMTR